MTLSSRARVAVFYAPEPDDRLSQLGAFWLGRDAETGATLRQPDIAEIEEITSEPRLYGLHATLKPPMRVLSRHRWDDVLRETETLAGSLAPFPLPPLEVASIGGFLALRESAASMQLQAMADLCVAFLDRLRAPAEEHELARRRKAGLSTSQEAMLRRYGYPYVFAAWKFHITLTRRLSAPEADRIAPAAERHFGAVLAEPRQVRSLCLFYQPAPGAPFLLRERFRLAA